MKKSEAQIGLIAGVIAALVAYYFFSQYLHTSSRIIYTPDTTWQPVQNQNIPPAPTPDAISAAIAADARRDPTGPGTTGPKPGDCFEYHQWFGGTQTVCYNPNARGLKN